MFLYRVTLSVLRFGALGMFGWTRVGHGQTVTRFVSTFTETNLIYNIFKRSIYFCLNTIHIKHILFKIFTLYYTHTYYIISY